MGINKRSWHVKDLLTIANAWLRVEQEQEADDFASAFVKVSFVGVLSYCPFRTVWFLFVWFLFV
jgi:hypothetical protein